MIVSDVTDARRAGEAGERANAILKAVGVAVSSAPVFESLESRLEAMLRSVGRAAEASRAYVFRNHASADASVLTTQICEWTAPDVSSIKELDSIPMRKAGFGRWVDTMRGGIRSTGWCASSRIRSASRSSPRGFGPFSPCPS